jgi:murein DD-endopeptidase MepM/ murein hydrolase activator NlpD
MSAAGSNFTLRPAHRWRLPLLALVLTAGAFLPAAAPAAVAGRPVPPPSPGPDAPRVPALWMPVAGAVVRGFDARAGPYGPGHRGIDIAAPVGEMVRAPAAGKVVFAGPVAGTTWVSLLVAPGVVVTLGPLLDPVTAGRVRPRAPIGRVGPGHQPGSGGPGGATLHLGVRVDGFYVDPLAYLVDRPRARLAPLATPGGLPGR